jgi:hypothetical protein
VDRRLKEIYPTLHAVNETVLSSYRTVNQTYRSADEDRPTQPIQLYVDGAGISEAGKDASLGGQGGWTTVGTDTWRRGTKAAHTGESGFTSASLADGTYVGNAHAMLLSPALDLQAGFADPAFRSSYTLLAPLFSQVDPLLANAHTSGERLLSISGVYAALWYNLEHEVLHPPNNNLCGGGPCWDVPGVHADSPGDALYQLEFYARFSLAAGHDFVRAYVFEGSEAPDEAPSPATCPSMVGPSCTFAHPTEGYARAGPPAALDPADGFTATTGWESYHLDLTHWAESHKRIWIGFVFDSESYASSKRFKNPALFPPSTKFFGFELDDLRLTAPSPPASGPSMSRVSGCPIQRTKTRPCRSASRSLSRPTSRTRARRNSGSPRPSWSDACPIKASPSNDCFPPPPWLRVPSSTSTRPSLRLKRAATRRPSRRTES